jgi:hypothetical protein
MRQEINLLTMTHGAGLPRLSFRVFSFLSVVFFSGLIVLTWYGNKQLGEISKDIIAIEKSNYFQQQKVVDTDDISKYQTQLKSLEKQLLSKYQLWINYKNITQAGKDGFSQHFYHIATLADRDLSLYEIDVYERGNSLALKGYARKAEFIPIYIDKLKKQEEFKNVYFGDLSIEKIDGHEVMRFSLAKKELLDKMEKTLEKPIDISELMNIPLANSHYSVDGKMANIGGLQQ